LPFIKANITVSDAGDSVGVRFFNRKMNKKLKKIFEDDQNDRKNLAILQNPVVLNNHDNDRKRLVQSMIKDGSIMSGQDYYHAAMIFQHGQSIRDSERAVAFSKKAIELKFKKARSLYASCVDRLLTKQGKKQKFGTQYRKINSESPWELMPLDGTVTDEDRALYDIKSLEELKRRINKLNRGLKQGK
jgi:hypothetical protein